MNKVRVKVVVRGRVQGVFFRESTKRAARAGGVTGWVKNAQDGSVEAVLEGPRADVQGMVEFMKLGPEDARVDTVEVHEEPFTGEFSEFQVRRG